MNTTNETDLGKLRSLVEDLSKRLETVENSVFMTKEVLSLEEAASFLSVSRSALYKMTHLNEIPYYKPNGKKVYFEKSELMAWMRRSRIASAKEIEAKAKSIISEMGRKSL